MSYSCKVKETRKTMTMFQNHPNYKWKHAAAIAINDATTNPTCNNVWFLVIGDHEIDPKVRETNDIQKWSAGIREIARLISNTDDTSILAQQVTGKETPTNMVDGGRFSVPKPILRKDTKYQNDEGVLLDEYVGKFIIIDQLKEPEPLNDEFPDCKQDGTYLYARHYIRNLSQRRRIPDRYAEAAASVNQIITYLIRDPDNLMTHASEHDMIDPYVLYQSIKEKVRSTGQKLTGLTQFTDIFAQKLEDFNTLQPDQVDTQWKRRLVNVKNVLTSFFQKKVYKQTIFLETWLHIDSCKLLQELQDTHTKWNRYVGANLTIIEKFVDALKLFEMHTTMNDPSRLIIGVGVQAPQISTAKGLEILVKQFRQHMTTWAKSTGCKPEPLSPPTQPIAKKARTSRPPNPSCNNCWHGQ